MSTKKAPAPIRVGSKVTGRTHRGTPIAGRVVALSRTNSGTFAEVKQSDGSKVSTRPSLLALSR